MSPSLFLQILSEEPDDAAQYKRSDADFVKANPEPIG